MAVDDPGNSSENDGAAKNSLQEDVDGREDDAEGDHKGSDDEDDDEGTQSYWRVKQKEGCKVVTRSISSLILWTCVAEPSVYCSAPPQKKSCHSES
jgi:hypothetical protein